MAQTTEVHSTAVVPGVSFHPVVTKASDFAKTGGTWNPEPGATLSDQISCRHSLRTLASSAA